MSPCSNINGKDKQADSEKLWIGSNCIMHNSKKTYILSHSDVKMKMEDFVERAKFRRHALKDERGGKDECQDTRPK